MPDRLKATVSLPYGNHVYGPGEEFIASYVDAKTLVLLGKATRVEIDPEELAAKGRQVTEYQTRVVEVSKERPAEVEMKRKRGRPRKGEYNRRDMTAEE